MNGRAGLNNRSHLVMKICFSSILLPSFSFFHFFGTSKQRRNLFQTVFILKNNSNILCHWTLWNIGIQTFMETDRWIDRIQNSSYITRDLCESEGLRFKKKNLVTNAIYTDKCCKMEKKTTNMQLSRITDHSSHSKMVSKIYKRLYQLKQVFSEFRIHLRLKRR